MTMHIYVRYMSDIYVHSDRHSLCMYVYISHHVYIHTYSHIHIYIHTLIYIYSYSASVSVAVALTMSDTFFVLLLCGYGRGCNLCVGVGVCVWLRVRVCVLCVRVFVYRWWRRRRATSTRFGNIYSVCNPKKSQSCVWRSNNTGHLYWDTRRLCVWKKKNKIVCDRITWVTVWFGFRISLYIHICIYICKVVFGSPRHTCCTCVPTCGVSNMCVSHTLMNTCDYL